TWDGLPPAQSPLVTEDTSMLFSDPSTFTQIMEAAPELDLRIMDVLPFDDGEPAAFGGAATGVMSNPESSRSDAAWEFIQTIGDPELNNQYAEDVGHVPVHASAIESEYVQETPAVAATVENADYFRSNPNIPAWTQVRDTLAEYIEQALSGQLTAQDALDQAAAEVEQTLAEESLPSWPTPLFTPVPCPRSSHRGPGFQIPGDRAPPDVRGPGVLCTGPFRAPGSSWSLRPRSTSSSSSWLQWSMAWS